MGYNAQCIEHRAQVTEARAEYWLVWPVRVTHMAAAYTAALFPRTITFSLRLARRCRGYEDGGMMPGVTVTLWLGKEMGRATQPYHR